MFFYFYKLYAKYRLYKKKYKLSITRQNIRNIKFLFGAIQFPSLVCLRTLTRRLLGRHCRGTMLAGSPLVSVRKHTIQGA